ncbi:MAG: DNA polymerase I [Bowdeniella nasicola]|nr:DNA polymerase I [Bowdeniella nasicola]
MKRLLLIDGHSMAFRAFYALPVENFATSTGTITNAVHGFCSMLCKLVEDEAPTHLAVAFDAGSTTFRTRQYPDYKAGRAKTPEEFKPQIPLIKQLLDALGVVWVEKDDIEADDIIATLAAAGQHDGEVLICSGDRDTFQLVTDTTTVLYPTRGVSQLTRYTPRTVEERYGVSPQRYRELAALVGEKADNLPGVPGVGDKTAAKWLRKYDGLDNIIAHADDIGGKVGQSLRDNLDNVIRNRELNALLRDVDLPVDIAALEIKPIDNAAVAQLFDSLEFNQLRTRVSAAFPSTGDHETAADQPEVSTETWRADGEVASFISTHTAGKDPQRLAVALDDDRLILASASAALIVPLSEVDPGDDAVLRAWLAGDDPKVVHDGKALIHALDKQGYALDGIVFDTRLAAYLLHPERRRQDLARLTQQYLHRELNARESSDGQLALQLDPGADNAALGEQTAVIAELGERLSRELAEVAGLQLMSAMELPVQRILADMETIGIAVDQPAMTALRAELDRDVQSAARDAASAIDGKEINLSSPKQLQQVLFEDLQMPKTKRTKTGWTTDAEALAHLYEQTHHPFLAAVLAHRDRIKLRQVVDGLIAAVGDDGRIHTTFQQTVAATGRLSSTDPNLQNIPTRTETGIRIRDVFVCGQDYETLMTADYSQIEMRIMAHLSGDSDLIGAFNAGEDLHSYVGARVFNVGIDEITPPMRAKVKAMSYGLAYGLSAYGLSRQLDVEVYEAQQLMDDYFARFGAVRDYLASVVEKARATGYTETMFGRRRYLPDLSSTNRQRREMAERAALNAPIQGSAADIIKYAMIAVAERLAGQHYKSRMLLQVHDELVLEIAPGEVEAVTALVREEMGAAAHLTVPLSVSVGTGPTWRKAAH